jgi:hypothetical protein
VPPTRAATLAAATNGITHGTHRRRFAAARVSGGAEPADFGFEIVDGQRDAVPAAGFGSPTVGHWSARRHPARSARSAPEPLIGAAWQISRRGIAARG